MGEIIGTSDAYMGFIESVGDLATASATAVDVQITDEDFNTAFVQAQSDASSFWGHASTPNQAMALLMTHVQEIVATTRQDHIVLIVNQDGYLARRK